MFVALAALGLSLGTPALGAGVGRYATDLKVSEAKATNETVVTVSFSAEPTYMAHFADAKRRLLVDVMDSELRGIPATFDRPVGLVEGILTQSFSSAGAPSTRRSSRTRRGRCS